MNNKQIKQVICYMEGIGTIPTGMGGGEWGEEILLLPVMIKIGVCLGGEGRMRGGRSGSSTKHILLKSRFQNPPHKSPA